MSSSVRGAERVRRRLGELTAAVKREVDKANAKSGAEMERIAKVLHPGDGANRAAINSRPLPDGSTLVDFGPKAKVTEGNRGPRAFVNPTLKVTEKKRTSRARYAVRKAVKEVFGG